MATALGLSLVACGSKEETKKFEGTVNGIKIENTYTAKDDKIIKQVSKNVIKYADLNITKKEDKEKINAMIKQKIDENNKLKGVKDELKISDTELVENIEIDYTKADLKELKEKKVIQADGDLSKGLSMSKTAEAQKNSGLKEVKK